MPTTREAGGSSPVAYSSLFKKMDTGDETDVDEKMIVPVPQITDEIVEVYG